MATDLVGLTFERLKVINFVESRLVGKTKRRFWNCLCECGKYIEVAGSSLTTKNTKSCGCLLLDSRPNLNRKHSQSESPTYSTWAAMVQRCTNTNNENYAYYGGSGVRILDGWEDFTNFYADMGDKPEGMSIDRIDPIGHYGRENCQWATALFQAHNRKFNKRNSGVGLTATGKWRARIVGLSGNSEFLGTYDNESDALAVYEVNKKAVLDALKTTETLPPLHKRENKL